MRAMAAAALVGISLAGQAWAQGWDTSRTRTYPFNVPTPLVDDRSAFVSVPASVGFYSGMLAGLVPGLALGLPLALGERAATGEVSQSTANVITAPAVYTGVAMHYAAGTPFYLTKLVFWDLPRGLLRRM
ncbi:MAG: hypothetical protein FJ291_21350 [Planctomycetes bacterium]|nr:hypothetical protein [Planctomycetota bacterium]